jgi:citrate lyase beta subunit
LIYIFCHALVEKRSFSLRHNNVNDSFKFAYAPESFNKYSDKEFLQYCLGGTLYMPGTKDIVSKIIEGYEPDLKSMVMCFEDAISEEDLARAEQNVLNHLDVLSIAINNGQIKLEDVPLIFLRVRNFRQFTTFSESLNKNNIKALSGFVLPKFYSNNAHDYLEHLKELNERLETRLFAMPILEGRAIAYKESRVSELEKLKLILDSYQDIVLNIRVGGTDLSAFFGVRRSIQSSIYDILPVRDALSDILNFFNRTEDTYTVSAPVWEYFLAYKKDDIDRYLEDDIHRTLMNNEPILNEAIDGLLREIIQDKANGMVGKTVIHPSHLRYVNALQAVTLEEFEDARQILTTRGGVVKSLQGNKMNEVAPHSGWARKTILRARAYGVINNESDYLKLFHAEVRN